MQTYQKAWCTFLFILVATVSQAQLSFKTPADYNDYIIMEQTAIGRKLEAFNQALASNDLKNAKKEHSQLVVQLNASIQKMGELPDYKGNTAFKNAAFELFTFYKMIIENDYVKIMNLVEKEGINDNTFARINSIFVSIQRDEAVMMGLFNKAQENFSKEFDMKIQENEFEKERREKTDTLSNKK